MARIDDQTTQKPSDNIEEMNNEFQKIHTSQTEVVTESVDWDGKPLTEKQIETKKMEIDTLQKFLIENIIAKKLESFQEFDLKVKTPEEKKSSFVNKLKNVFKKETKIPTLHVEVLDVDGNSVYGRVNGEMFRFFVVNAEKKIFNLHYVNTVIKNNSTYYQYRNVNNINCEKIKFTEKSLPTEIRKFIEKIEDAEMLKNENTL